MTHYIGPHLERARQLIEAGDQQSLVYAALELRLGIELVCYEKMRMRLGHVSAAEIRDWRPRPVLEALAELADPLVTQQLTLHRKDDPTTGEGTGWVQVAEQKEIDPKRLSDLWNKLSNFLHVQAPREQRTAVHAYPDPKILQTRLPKMIEDLESLTHGSDIHLVLEPTYFHCTCGYRLQRATSTLRDGQVIMCSNPNCRKEWVVEARDGQHGFHSNVTDLACRECGHMHHFDKKPLRDMQLGQVRLFFNCDACGARHKVRCRVEYSLVEDETGALD